MIDIPSIPIYSSSTGSFGTSRDLPSLDLAFALDKTLTARRGPTPVFSRGTSATLVNESGLIQYAPENLFLNSGGASRISFSATKYSSNELDPDGGSSCLMVVETNVASQARTELLSSYADAYTRRRVFSWWVKPSPGVTLPAYLHLVYKDNARVSFSTATWSVATQTDGATGSIVESNGWYKLIAYLPGETSSSTTHKLVFTDTDYYGGPLTAIRGLLVGSGQLSSGTFAWPHFQTLTNPYYAPRFDHDPVTHACKGLLIEGEGRNLLPRSNELNVTPWVPATVTRSQVIGAGLDGGPAWLLVPTGTDSSLGQTHTVASSVPHTFSVYLKSDTGANVSISLSVYDNTAGTNRGVKPITITPQWQRFDITTSTVVAGNSTAFLIGAFGSWTTGENILAWGVQLETGSFPTSYIPTTTTALTRSADVCSISGTDFTEMYNGLEGAIIAEGSVANLAGNNRGMWAINNNTSAHGFLTYYDVTAAGISSQSRNTGSTTLTSNFLNSANTLFKRALAYRTGQASICTNGSSVTTTDVTISTQTMLTLQVGNMLAGSFYWSGHIARIRYFKKRLPDAKLQSLTTL